MQELLKLLNTVEFNSDTLLMAFALPFFVMLVQFVVPLSYEGARLMRLGFQCLAILLASAVGYKLIQDSGRVSFFEQKELFFHFAIALMTFFMAGFMFRGAAGPGGGGFGLKGLFSRRQRKSYLQPLFEVESEKITAQDIAIPPSNKNEISLLVGSLQKIGEAGALGVEVPKGVMVLGQKGAGSTLMARYIAHSVGVPVLRVYLDRLFSNVLKSGPMQELTRLFREAVKLRECVLVFDELDRTVELYTSKDPLASALLRKFFDGLAEIEKLPGVIVVGTTQQPQFVDQKIQKAAKLYKIVNVGALDADTRAEIFKIALRGKLVSGRIDHTNLSQRTAGFTARAIVEVVNRASMVALQRSSHSENSEDAGISHYDLETVLDELYKLK